MLPIAEYAHNSWRHEATRQTPHQLLIRYKPQVNIKLIEDHVPAATDQINELIKTRNKTQERLETIQGQKEACKILTLKEGSQVWLEAKNLKIKGTQKLMPKWYGLYKIIEQINPMAYCLQLPENMSIHNVFHIDLLSPYKTMEAYGEPYMCPPPILEEEEEEYEIEAILNM
jgi:hypothetical protein